MSQEHRDRLIEMRESGVSFQECAYWYTEESGQYIGKTTIRDKLLEWGIENAALSNQVVSQINVDKKLDNWKAEAGYYRRLYSEILKQHSGVDKIVDALTRTVQAIPKVTMDKSIFIPEDSSYEEQVAVAPFSDAHIGEKVDLAQMSGLNQYDIDIFNRRTMGWTDSVIKLVNLRRRYANVRYLVTPLLGDMVSGEIHDELIRTNEEHVMGQALRGANILAQALIKLSQHFDVINVPCVPGNHGRTEKHKYFKNSVSFNWDTLFYNIVALHCKDYPNIRFRIAKSRAQVINVANHRILVTHGDIMKNYSTAVSYYNVLRFANEYRHLLQSKRQKRRVIGDEVVGDDEEFDAIMIGHFHRIDELDIGTGPLLICGCIKGGDEYALEKLQVYSSPKQLLSFWDARFGMLGKEIIYLERFDRSEKTFIDVLS